MLGSLSRSQTLITNKAWFGPAFLATVGSTSPFVGLLGTVIGILNAPSDQIGAAGDASIDKVAGPVGEALIMTAIGLIVAVPAVMGYNWLLRRNKLIGEDLGKFSQRSSWLHDVGRCCSSCRSCGSASCQGCDCNCKGLIPLKEGCRHKAGLLPSGMKRKFWFLGAV